MSNILLLEDDLSLINGLSFAFKKQGFELVVARTLKEADSLWMDGKYDLLVLDVSLPDGTGFEFCKKVRQVSKVPIIFLTAADEEMDIIMGLDIGGDDYITKPFNPLEMVSRVKAQLRRYTLYNGAETLENKEIFDSAGLIVNHQTHVCTLYEKEIALTPIFIKFSFSELPLLNTQIHVCCKYPCHVSNPCPMIISMLCPPVISS